MDPLPRWTTKTRISQHTMPTRYPMLVVAVPVLLGLAEMIPHQRMLADKLLVPYDASMVGRVIFVSHQWTGHHHPDPSGAQMRTLRAVLGRLLRG